MSKIVNSARRGFLWKAGAALSAPLGLAAASAPAHAHDERDAVRARLGLLEDMDAIRELTLRYVRHANAREQDEVARLFADAALARIDGARTLSPDPFGADAIVIAPDRGSATSRVSCTAHVETPIEPVTPLVAMARAQGGGVTRRAERGALVSSYVKRDGVWKIERLAFHAT